MENHLEHFLPKGQTEIEDSIFICDDTTQCETCSSFLYTLCVAQIKAFVEDDDFITLINKENGRFKDMWNHQINGMIV